MGRNRAKDIVTTATRVESAIVTLRYTFRVDLAYSQSSSIVLFISKWKAAPTHDRIFLIRGNRAPIFAARNARSQMTSNSCLEASLLSLRVPSKKDTSNAIERVPSTSMKKKKEKKYSSCKMMHSSITSPAKRIMIVIISASSKCSHGSSGILLSVHSGGPNKAKKRAVVMIIRKSILSTNGSKITRHQCSLAAVAASYLLLQRLFTVDTIEVFAVTGDWCVRRISGSASVKRARTFFSSLPLFVMASSTSCISDLGSCPGMSPLIMSTCISSQIKSFFFSISCSSFARSCCTSLAKVSFSCCKRSYSAMQLSIKTWKVEGSAEFAKSFSPPLLHLLTPAIVVSTVLCSSDASLAVPSRVRSCSSSTAKSRFLS
mmetsp:Transcript_124312/g.247825  ORF Transcript_124312/g.247825 Transcript_124312/m.247825 type:complete len:374 (-) Transcript_124312:332-1453(-)